MTGEGGTGMTGMRGAGMARRGC